MIELQSGKTWEQFVKERIFDPLQMNSTSYSIADMVKRPEFGVGFTERRDSFELYKIPYYEDISGVAPCGAIVSTRYVPLVDRPDEPWEIRRQAGTSNGSA
jgi:CubicO group peptidase (beta-lactamase class C family)